MRTEQKAEWFSASTNDGYFTTHIPCGTKLNLPIWAPMHEINAIVNEHMKECTANEVSTSVPDDSQ